MTRIYVRQFDYLRRQLAGYIVDDEPRTVAELTMVEQPEDYQPAPTMYIKPDEAQHMMDQLWDCGLRPSEGTGSAGALAATQKHLEDMRKLTFDLFAEHKGY